MDSDMRRSVTVCNDVLTHLLLNRTCVLADCYTHVHVSMCQPT